MQAAFSFARRAPGAIWRAMAEIINLRQARKARQRGDAAKAADANRARHGRGKAERAVQALETARAARLLDGARRETPDSEGE